MPRRKTSAWSSGISRHFSICPSVRAWRASSRGVRRTSALIPLEKPLDKSIFRMVIRTRESSVLLTFPRREEADGVRDLLAHARPTVGRRALALSPRAGSRARRRRGRLQVRLVAGASLPHPLLASARARDLPVVGGGAHAADPRRLRHHQHHPAREPPRARRAAARHHAPPLSSA